MLKGTIKIHTIESVERKYRKYDKNYALIELTIGDSTIIFGSMRTEYTKRGYFSYYNFFQAEAHRLAHSESFPVKRIDFMTALEFVHGDPVPLVPEEYTYEFTFPDDPNNESLKKFLITLAHGFKDNSFMKVLEEFVTKIGV